MTSGMGGGASSTARLSAQIAQQQGRIDEIEACGSAGRLYGPAHGNINGAECILNMLLGDSGSTSFTGQVGITSNAGTLNLIGTDHSYIQYFPDGSGAGRKAYIGFGSAGSDSFNIYNETADQLAFGTSGAGRMYILGNGRVGIATASPTHGLHVNSTGRFNSAVQLDSTLSVGGTSSFSNNVSITGNTSVSGSVSAQTYYHTSDERLKTSIRPFTTGPEIISKLRPVRYFWKDTSEASIGFIAQDVGEVLPEAVKENAAGYMAVDYDLILAPVVATLQAQDAKLQEQQRQIENLEDMVEALSRRLE